MWFLAHVPFLAPALEDIDSINFALGLHHYDPALHQPHPPGYPVFIAAGRLSLVLIHVVAPGLSYGSADALALAVWSAIGGALAIVAAGHLFRDMTMGGERAAAVGFWGATLLALTPLFWITGLRPMSDMLGLGVALAAQALLLRGTIDGRFLIAGAAVAGLAAGIRTQTVPLTLPLLAYALLAQRRRGVWLIRPLAALAAGGLVWAVPLVVVTGGLSGYLRALGSQAGEDFAWADMLWANPTPRAIAFALYDTFLLPFANPVTGGIVLAIGAVGMLRMLIVDSRAFVLVAVAYVPYAMFHLLFQEPGMLRYATPLVVPIAFAAAFLVCSLDLSLASVTKLPIPNVLRTTNSQPFPSGAAGLALSRPPRSGRHRFLLAAPLVLLLVMPNVVQPSSLSRPADIPIVAGYRYGREAHPAFRAIDDMKRLAERQKPAAVFSHYSLRRPLQAAPTSLPVLEPRRNLEWLALADYWLKGGREQVWFLADPKRTDLALIDPQVRRPGDHTQYLWSVADRPELMGTRPLGVDWYRLDQPGWFTGEGWELTPETTGVARAANKRLYQQPITAYVRRQVAPMAAVIAGRNLGPVNDPPSIIEVTLDGRSVDRWRVDPSKDGINFFHVMQLPEGIPVGPGNYAALTISATAEQPGVATPQVAVEQFDIQPLHTVMFGYGQGWQESEYNNRTGLTWRWTSDRATLRIVPERSVAITLRGESPLKYFASPPTVRVRAGARQLAVFRPTRDFTWRVQVPGSVLMESGGTVTIETDKVYLPGQAEGTADARRLGLRVFEVRVEAAAQ